MGNVFRLASVVGTRPEAIKVAPMVIEAARHRDIAHRLIATGQHDAMCHDALAGFGLVADEALQLPRFSATIEGAVSAIEQAMTTSLLIDRPDMLIVQGDTSSAYAAARAAKKLNIPIAHVEAGLRSYDLAHPFPEEGNRVAIDTMADLLLAPTPEAAANLAADKQVRGQVVITGNTGIDALFTVRAAEPALATGPRPFVLVTCHRRENIGVGLAGICRAVERLAARGDVDLLLPLHPNPAVRGHLSAALLGLERVILLEPLPYPTMVATMAAAHLILTDSGGIQEEAAALGTPCLVLRQTTERPEGIVTRNLALVGTDPDRIITAATRLLDDPTAHSVMAAPSLPYGDGKAAPKVIAAVRAWLTHAHDQERTVAFDTLNAQSLRPVMN